MKSALLLTWNKVLQAPHGKKKATTNAVRGGGRPFSPPMGKKQGYRREKWLVDCSKRTGGRKRERRPRSFLDIPESKEKREGVLQRCQWRGLPFQYERGEKGDIKLDRQEQKKRETLAIGRPGKKSFSAALKTPPEKVHFKGEKKEGEEGKVTACQRNAE